jgi:enamine deaminase RidA (YjgF/YER057c/UK114 family)
MGENAAPKVLGTTVASYSLGRVVEAGRVVFVSGQIALDENEDIVGADDVGAQSSYIFGQIDKLLAEAGAGLADVVKITTYLTDMSRYKEFAAARERAFTKPYPASAAVGASALFHPSALVEIEAIAVI